MIAEITFPLRGGSHLSVTRTEAVAAAMRASADYRAAMYGAPLDSPIMAVILEHNSIMLKAAAYFAANPVAALEWPDSKPIRITLLIDEALIFERLGEAMEIVDAELIRLRAEIQQAIAERAVRHAKRR